MAKKDTYLALLRRGVDETTAMTLADSGLKIGEIKKFPFCKVDLLTYIFYRRILKSFQMLVKTRNC